MNRTALQSIVAALSVALLPVAAGAQPTPPREVRYCTSCATVQSVQVLNAGAGAKQYVMVIRYDDGSTRSFSYANDPGLRVGEKVKDNGGVVVRDVAGKGSP